MDAALAERAEEFTRSLFHDRAIEQDGARLCLTMETGERIAVDIGFRAGTWTMNGEEGHGLSLLWATARGVIHKHALSDCAQWLGGEMDAPEPEPVPIQVVKSPAPNSQPPPQRNGSTPERSKTPEIQKLLPQDLSAEKGLLSAFLENPDHVGRLCKTKGVMAGHFHHPANAVVYDELLYLWEERMPCDFITITGNLGSRGELEKAGGAVYITELQTYGGRPSFAYGYIDSLEECYAARQGFKLTSEYNSRFLDHRGDIAELLSEFQEKAASIQLGGRRIKLPDLEGVAQWTKEEDLPIEPPQVVKGLLHQGSKLIIGGTSKGRKTFALLDLAASVAAGVPWWGVPTNQGRVCYLNFELQRFAIARRVRWIHEAKAIPLTDNFQMMTLRGWTDPIENLSEKLIEYFRALPPFALIVFDPVYKLLGDRDENKVGDVTQLLNHIEKIGVETGAATAFGHHYSKGNQAAKESIDRMGGSGAFARDPDAILTMTAHETEDCFVIEPTVRNFAPVTKFVIRWDAPLFKPAANLNPENLKLPPRKDGAAGAPRKNDQLHKAKVSLGRFFAHKKQNIRALLVSSCGVKPSSFDNYWAALKDAGLIVQVGSAGGRRVLWIASNRWDAELEIDYPPINPDLSEQ